MFSGLLASHQTSLADQALHAVFDPLRLAGIGNYWRVVGASLAAHTLLYRAVPALSAAVVPRIFGRLSAADRKTWAVSAICLAHCVYDVCVIAAYFHDPALNGDRMDGFNTRFEWHLAVALGYYAWDLGLCVRDFGNYGPMYLIHGVLGVFGLLILTSQQLQFYAIPYLLPELSSIFLHARQLLKLAGRAGTVAYKANFAVFLATYVATRIGFEAYQSALLIAAVVRGQTGGAFYPFAVFFAVLGVTLTVLNTIWLRQILRAAYHTILQPTGEPPAKAE
ncbi:hypothetical protein IWQ57_002994 [Coemansia nantahalensis]|uniref:Uncharacterized protein n=2 Tax=Coemansia TaxID=4863 RepID=A0ACC1L4L5_9FUNG|nr:hypothetical protein IWQ57_002994 [Coemansia nantahalensis]KAJ2800759.1 hypothetical protein H4R21_003047 [Coemansia helicoidea]